MTIIDQVAKDEISKAVSAKTQKNFIAETANYCAALREIDQALAALNRKRTDINNRMLDAAVASRVAKTEAARDSASPVTPHHKNTT